LSFPSLFRPDFLVAWLFSIFFLLKGGSLSR
jgi:hypothetical protein